MSLPNMLNVEAVFAWGVFHETHRLHAWSCKSNVFSEGLHFLALDGLWNLGGRSRQLFAKLGLNDLASSPRQYMAVCSTGSTSLGMEQLLPYCGVLKQLLQKFELICFAVKQV